MKITFKITAKIFQSIFFEKKQNCKNGNLELVKDKIRRKIKLLGNKSADGITIKLFVGNI